VATSGWTMRKLQLLSDTTEKALRWVPTLYSFLAATPTAMIAPAVPAEPWALSPPLDHLASSPASGAYDRGSTGAGTGRGHPSAAEPPLQRVVRRPTPPVAKPHSPPISSGSPPTRTAPTPPTVITSPLPAAGRSPPRLIPAGRDWGRVGAGLTTVVVRYDVGTAGSDRRNIRRPSAPLWHRFRIKNTELRREGASATGAAAPSSTSAHAASSSFPLSRLPRRAPSSAWT